MRPSLSLIPSQTFKRVNEGRRVSTLNVSVCHQQLAAQAHYDEEGKGGQRDGKRGRERDLLSYFLEWRP